MNFEEAFLRLNCREPTGEERRDALMIQDVVRGAGLDPVLLVFLALGKYKTLCRQGVQRIATAVDEAALQAATIGERVGREARSRLPSRWRLEKLTAAIERRSTPAHERTKQLAFGTAIAIIVAGAFLAALAIGHGDGTAAAHTHFEAIQWSPSWAWILSGVVLAEGVRILVRPFTFRTWTRDG